jgi:hypothetical protein
MKTPVELVREGRSKEAFEAVLKESSSREVGQAFTNEVQPLLENHLSRARVEIVELFTNIMDGKFPNNRVQHAVMRYKPLSMTDEQFLEALYDPYEKWVKTTTIG